MRRVRDLGWSPGVGLHYTHGGRDYVVYTGQSREGWDAAELTEQGIPGPHHGVCGHPTPQAAAQALFEFLTSEERP